MLSAIDVPVAQVTALIALEARNGCRVKDLGVFLGMNKSGATGLADRMEKNRLLMRKVDKDDGRAIRLYITAKGRDLLGKAKPIIKTENKNLEQDFSPEEMNVILRFLNKVSTKI